ncbi:MAG: hypothetical protein ACFFCQ_18475 [Promethearchaeota archaeon]
MIIQIAIFLCYMFTFLSLSLQEEFLSIWKLGIAFVLTYFLIAVLSISNKFYKTILNRSILFLLLLGVIFPLTFFFTQFISNSLTESNINLIGHVFVLFGLFMQPFIFIHTAKQIAWQSLNRIEETSQKAYIVWIFGIVSIIILAGFIGLVFPNFFTFEEDRILILPILSIVLVACYLTVAYVGYVAGTLRPAPTHTLTFSGISGSILFFFLSFKGMTTVFALFDYLNYSQIIDAFLMSLMTIIGVYLIHRADRIEASVLNRFLYYCGLLSFGLFLGAQLWILGSYFEGYHILLAFVHGVGILIGLYAAINSIPVFLSSLGIIPDEKIIPLFNLITTIEIDGQRTLIESSHAALEVEWGHGNRRGKRKYLEFTDTNKYQPDEIGEEDDPSLGTPNQNNGDYDYDDEDYEDHE